VTTRCTVGQTLDYLRSKLGVGEHPDGSNCQEFSAAVGRPCEAWCADCATAVMRHCGIDDGKNSAAARILAQQFKDAGQWHTTPAPGDLAFYIWDGDTVIHHVEFVESVRSTSPLDIVCIGGNVSNKVTRTARRSHIVGFGRPVYAGGTPKPKPAPKPAPHDPPWYHRQLSNRSPMLTGDDVSHVQRVVGAGVDGKYGPRTAARVKAWQQAHHVKPYDGIVGPITARAMG
jgi:peptidoglycan hydrolase-like protein with peptidoglycan-binding domain